MNPNELRCPQCGSPVLATANYCVICGIRLPERVETDNHESSGWGTPRTSREEIAAIPPIDIPEFDEPELEIAGADAVAPKAEATEPHEYASIPDVDLEALNAYLSAEQVTEAAEPDAEQSTTDTSDTVVEGETRDEEVIESDIVTMFDEGSPTSIPDQADVPGSLGDREVVDLLGDEAEGMLDESAELVAIELPDAPADSAREINEVDDPDEDAVGMIAEGAPAQPAESSDAESTEPEDSEPLEEEDERAIEMIDEGAPVYPGESTYVPNEMEIDESPAAVDHVTSGAAPIEPSTAVAPPPEAADLSGFILELDDEPAPMISASYPHSAPHMFDTTESHAWWPGTTGDDWVYSELEREVTELAAQAPGIKAAEAKSDPASLDRANALIEELKSLLPQLANSVAPESGPNLDELKTMAIAARGERSFDDWAALRQVIGAAVGRSADIETILQLSKRVDDIAALIAERDRLQDSFKRIADWIDANSGE